MPNQIVFALDNKEILQQTYDFLLSHFEKSLFDLEKERVFSHLVDHSFLQMSYSFRARQLANLLIDKQGELDRKTLKDTIDFLENKGFICYPNGYSGSVITEHQIAILKQFTSPKIVKLLYRFSPPVCHKAAENLLFDSLGISAGKLHISDIRRGVLCASLTPPPSKHRLLFCYSTRYSYTERTTSSVFSRLLSTFKHRSVKKNL